MKKILCLLLLIHCLVPLVAVASDTVEKRYKVGVFFWHESSNDYLAFEGIKKGFTIAGVDPEFDIQKAQGDEKQANKIIHRWIKQKPDMIYAMGTRATKMIMELVHDTPIVFTAVTNPVLAGITPDWQTSGRNIAGNSNWIPTKHILLQFLDVVPHLQSLGVIYDPGNIVSSMELRSGREAAGWLGLELTSVEVKSVDDLSLAAKALVEKGVDAIWVPIDILVYTNLDKVRQHTDPLSIPLLSSSQRGLKNGAIFGVTVDYQTLGMHSVPISLKILLNGSAPESIPIGTLAGHNRIFNIKSAGEINYKIPVTALELADEIIQ